MSEDRVLKVELGELLDRLSMLFRVDIVTVVHGLEAGLVPRRIASDQEGMGRVEERDAASGVARREYDLETIELLAVVQEHIDRGAGMALRTGGAVVDPFAGAEISLDAVRGDYRRRAAFDSRDPAH